MGRHITATAPLTGIWAGTEQAVVAAFRRLSSAADARAFADIEDQQNRIRLTGRHWLVG